MSINRHGMDFNPRHHVLHMFCRQPMENFEFGPDMGPCFNQGFGFNPQMNSCFNFGFNQPYSFNQGNSLLPSLLSFGFGLLFGCGVGAAMSQNSAQQPTQNQPSDISNPADESASKVSNGVSTGLVATAKQFDTWAENASDITRKTDDFSLVGDDYKQAVQAKDDKKAAAIYKNDVIQLAQDSVKKYDKDGDGLVSFEEYQAKEAADAKKVGVDPSDPAMQASYKRSFDTIDLNGDGKIDEKEQAAVFAAMDYNPDGDQFNGRISQNGFMGVSDSLGSPDKVKNVGDLIKKSYSKIFIS